MLWLLACTTPPPPAASAPEPEPEPVVVVELPPVPGTALLRDPAGLPDLESRPRYTLDLSISDVENRYEGRGTLTWTNRTGTTVAELPLLLHPNEPDELGAATMARLDLLTVEGGTQKALRESLVMVTLDTPAAPGDVVEFGFTFHGAMQVLKPESNDVWSQMGMSGGQFEAADYGLLGQGDGLLTASSAYPMVAPWTGQAFDTRAPSGIGDLAWNEPMVFEVRVVTPKGLDVVTNLVDTTEPLGDATLTRGEGAGVRDFVLVASREFDVKTARVDDITIRSWALKRDAAANEAALASAVHAVRELDRRIAPYPFTELDVVEATLTGGAGGVEFSSLLLVAGFLYRDPSSSQDPNFQMMQQLGGMSGGMGMPDLSGIVAEQRNFVVAHEVAHQWFPGLVGSDARNDPAVDEPLAQYLAGTLVEPDVRDRLVLANFALFRLVDGVDAPADRPTHEFSSTLEYAGLVYGKAPYLYVALEDAQGRDAVDAALAKAVREHAWGTVDAATWTASIGASKEGRRWLEEANGDEDFELDPEGRKALQLLLGDELAESLVESMGVLGMQPKDLFAMLGLGAAPQPPVFPGAEGPSAEEMMRMLDELEQ
ncbi:MAG: M1 family metallopeptidase [Proteobacteria bacterium]|nr:M1 family metallopeptidase [Pseudomonadota bacterium]MCP4917975.1 M1 family metallopeptidase [Pseudomonadota bacterium]